MSDTKPFADYPSYTPIMDYLKRKAKDSSEAGRSSSGGAPAEGTAHNSLGGGTAPAQAPATIYVWFAANGNIRKWDTKPFPEGITYSLNADAPQVLANLRGLKPPEVDASAPFCPVSESGCQETPICPWPCKRLKPCPYCASDNQAIRDTYYDQNCEGCVKRMIGTSSTSGAAR
jgi:hypothetical protein